MEDRQTFNLRAGSSILPAPTLCSPGQQSMVTTDFKGPARLKHHLDGDPVPVRALTLWDVKALGALASGRHDRIGGDGQPAGRRAPRATTVDQDEVMARADDERCVPLRLDIR